MNPVTARSKGSKGAQSALPGSSDDPKAPSAIGGRELHGLWHDLMEDWMGLPAQYYAERESGEADLALERMMRFEDPYPGILVIRSSRQFEAVLKEVSDKNNPHSSEGRDLFTEAVVHFWQRFIWMSCGQGGRGLKPARFKISTPSDWPAREPEAACYSFVGRCPVEIRYWVDSDKH